ncbi:MAG: PQQ-binding-like beta-propeller repeat protein [Opitutaceae bacterium]|nr:PQQ-binding-like beta-propeller repeat protein [Opitutaceae bacterium]
MKIPSRLISLVVLAASLGPATKAQEWTRFRGPNGTGISESKGVPVTWSEQDFVWRVPIAGDSHAQPVIWGDRIFLTTAIEDGKARALLCLSKADGRELWRQTYALAGHRPGSKNSAHANASPVVDAERVVALFVSRDHFWVRAFDHAGKEQWSRDLGRFLSQHGHGASPIIHDGKVIVTNDQDGESFVIALDLRSGEPAWTSPRRAVKGGAAYGTPILHQRADGTLELLLTSQGHGISGLDPRTGKLLWESPVFDKRMVASPLVAGEVVIGSCGSGGGGNYLSAVKLGGTGDVSSTHVAYTLRRATHYVPTPLYREGRVYVINDAGIASALEAATGKEIWSERLRAEFFASPVMIEGRIYVPSTKGEMIVLGTGDTFSLLARNPIGEGTHSTPCVDGGRLYVKTFTHLVCIGKK